METEVSINPPDFLRRVDFLKEERPD